MPTTQCLLGLLGRGLQGTVAVLLRATRARRSQQRQRPAAMVGRAHDPCDPRWLRLIATVAHAPAALVITGW